MAQLPLDKAPGPDGLPARFFQRNWDSLKENIIKAVREFFRTSIMPEGVNETVIILIPKVDEHVRMTDFRPISLCNVVYKIVAKCLLNRLRALLDDIISPYQSAFIPGRLITDNALLAFECLHFLQHEKNPENSYCAYKLDLAKAYDHVDWQFLKCRGGALGLDPVGSKSIMACVTSVKYKVRFNSNETELFSPSRGLRQGDPLSPYLFLLCSEGLSCLLAHEEEIRGIEGILVSRNAPSISHLLFVNDSLILMRGNTHNAQTLRRVLDL